MPPYVAGSCSLAGPPGMRQTIAPSTNSKPRGTRMSDNSNKGYSVGYRKLPKHSQFQKGQSGNPKGRPNGLANNSLSELFEKILSELMVCNIENNSKVCYQ